MRFSPKRAVRVVVDVFGQTPNGLLAIAFQSGVARGIEQARFNFIGIESDARGQVVEQTLVDQDGLDNVVGIAGNGVVAIVRADFVPQGQHFGRLVLLHGDEAEVDEGVFALEGFRKFRSQGQQVRFGRRDVVGFDFRAPECVEGFGEVSGLSPRGNEGGQFFDLGFRLVEGAKTLRTLEACVGFILLALRDDLAVVPCGRFELLVGIVAIGYSELRIGSFGQISLFGGLEVAAECTQCVEVQSPLEERIAPCIHPIGVMLALEGARC